MADDIPDQRMARALLQAAYGPQDEPSYTTADVKALMPTPTPSWYDQYVKPWGSAAPRDSWPALRQGVADLGAPVLGGAQKLSDALPSGVGDILLAGLLGPRLSSSASLRLAPWKEAGISRADIGLDKSSRLARVAGEPWYEQLAARLPRIPPNLVIMREDKPIGHMTYDVNGDTAYIHGINTAGNPSGPFSMADWRSLREQFRQLHPEVTRFEGYRVSGAKSHNWPEESEGRKQAIQMRPFGGRIR